MIDDENLDDEDLQHIIDRSFPKQRGTSQKQSDRKAEKDRMKAMKEQEKAQKKQAKQQEENQKKRQKEHEKTLKNQDTGRFHADEIALVLGEDIYDTEIGTKLGCSTYRESFKVSGLCVWTHRKKIHGGHGTINSQNSRIMDYAVVLFPSHEFLELAMLNDFDFVDLQARITSIKDYIQSFHKKISNTRLAIVLMDVDKSVSHRHKQKGGGAPEASITTVDDAISFLVVEMQIEVVKLKGLDELNEYLESATRILGEAVYKGAPTELDCVKKIPIKYPPTIRAEEKEEYELAKTWENMISMIPGVSEMRAKAFVKAYSCPRKVIAALSNPLLSLNEKKALFEFNFHDAEFSQSQGSNAPKSNKKISLKVFNMMTSDDPNAPLDA